MHALRAGRGAHCPSVIVCVAHLSLEMTALFIYLRRPPAKSAYLEGPILEAHIGTLHSPAVSHLLSDTTFPQLGILRVPLFVPVQPCWPDSSSEQLKFDRPQSRTGSHYLTGGTMSEEATGQKRMS